ncbi:hypothetical protein BDW74DRAFT_164888 [Aspergillus multicolor]|uniref:uncharacterized protein n=1 Tax=Aspergillus multicolor TaxID=41759 RepID=UPI003CCCF123
MALPEPIKMDALLQLLPACTRCRDVRKRCDTLLPACANCTRSGLKCTFYDSISKELLPREYISAMVDHLRSLEAARDRTVQTRFPSVPVTSPGTVMNTGRSYQFLGNRAPLITAAAANWKRQSIDMCPTLPSSFSGMGLVNASMHHSLVDKYLHVVDELFPVFDDRPVDFLESIRNSINPAREQTFVLTIVYSIACHCLPGNDNRLVYLSNALYQESMAHFESVMKDNGVGALRAVILLAIHGIFDGRTGSIGQLVNFAHRLEIELSSHTIPETISQLQRMRSAQSSTTEKAQFLCTVYTWHSRYRAGDMLISDTLSQTLLRQLQELGPSPMLSAMVHQMQFLIHANRDSARRLLSLYDDDRMTYDVYAPHWIYRAASYLISHAEGGSDIGACIIAAKSLERCATKWPNSKVLQRGLEDLRSNRRARS